MTNSRKNYIGSRFSRLLLALTAVLSFVIGFGFGDQRDQGGGEAARLASRSASIAPSIARPATVPAAAPAMDMPVALAAAETATPNPVEEAAPISRPQASQARKEAFVAEVMPARVETHDVAVSSLPHDPVQDVAPQTEVEQVVVVPSASVPVATAELQHASFQPAGDAIATVAEGHALSEQELAAVSPDPYGGVKTIAFADPLS